MEQMLQKQIDENESQYIWRIGQAKDAGILDLTWGELVPILNRELHIDKTEWRGESAWRKKYRVMQQAYDDIFSNMQFSSEYSATIEEQRRELKKEKIKIQTEKLEYNRWLREEARDELITEKIVSAIKELPPLKIPDILPARTTEGIYNHREGFLVYADTHYGADLKITGLFGEILNEYSPEIFEKRMWDLLTQIIDI